MYAGSERGKLKLFNPLEINDKIYQNQSTVGNIRFHYPKHHPFNRELAQKQDLFLTAFAKCFDLRTCTIDQYTDFRYVVGGLFVEMAEEKGGTEMIKQMLGAGRSDAELYGAVEKHLGVERANLNAYIRSRLAKEVKR